MWKRDRRQFLQDSGLVLGFAAFNSPINAVSLPDGNNHSSAKGLPQLFNTNLQTAIGLGDETPGIVDRFGQLDSRHAIVALQIGTTSLESPDSALALISRRRVLTDRKHAHNPVESRKCRLDRIRVECS